MLMKHVALILSALAAGVLSMTSCKSNFEQHIMQFSPAQPQMMVYADQTTDTTHVISTDPWSLTSNASWLTVTPNNFKPHIQGGLYNTKITLAVPLNTQRLTRSTFFEVKGNNTIVMRVDNVGWLNISTPNATYKDNNNDGLADRAHYATKVDAKATTLPFYFTTYTNGAVVQSNAAWIQIPTTASAPLAAGYHPLKLTVAQNTAHTERSAQITLTSAGITDTINVTQAAAAH